MLKNILIRRCNVFIAMTLILLFAFSGIATATDWEKEPTDTTKIQSGDTVYKNDGNQKAFDKSGKLIYDGNLVPLNSKDSLWENDGNYGGSTNIWWYYGITGWQNSGPKSESYTYGMALPSTDYLYARIRLYEDLSTPFGNWDLIASKSADEEDDDDVYVYESVLTYPFTWVMSYDFKGETKHKVQDEANSWDDIFYIDDSF